MKKYLTIYLKLCKEATIYRSETELEFWKNNN